MRQHRALGQRLGAAGVDDLRQVTGRQFHLDRNGRAGAKIREAQHVTFRLGLAFTGQADQALHRGVELRGLPAKRGQTGIDRQHAGARVTQYVGHFIGLQHEVDRHQHRTQPRQRKTQGRKSMRIAREDGDALTLGDTVRGEARREPVAQVVQLRVAPLHVVAANGQLVRYAPGGAAQQVADSLAVALEIHAIAFLALRRRGLYRSADDNPRRCYFGRGHLMCLSGWLRRPTRNSVTALATERATLRTSSCTALSLSSVSWLL